MHFGNAETLGPWGGKEKAQKEHTEAREKAERKKASGKDIGIAAAAANVAMLGLQTPSCVAHMHCLKAMDVPIATSH